VSEFLLQVGLSFTDNRFTEYWRLKKIHWSNKTSNIQKLFRRNTSSDLANYPILSLKKKWIQM